MNQPQFALGCNQPDCTFRASVTDKVQVAREHYDEEHPELDQLEMELIILCPEDGATLISGIVETGQIEGTYSCPSCMQTFTLKKAEMEQP